MDNDFFDPCECIYRVQRLLTILRQTQMHCSDTECLSVQRLPGSDIEESMPQQDFLKLFMIFAVVMLLYIFRPNSIRSTENSRKVNNATNSNNDSPGPPPAIN